jgi:hypothetical protein
MASREEGAPRQSLWHELLSRKIARRSLLSATAAASADAEGAPRSTTSTAGRRARASWRRITSPSDEWLAELVV